jgi:xanthine dehydrogenase accessory factor
VKCAPILIAPSENKIKGDNALKKLFSEALQLINNNEDFSLATVITLDGSAPRGPGAKMIIRRDGSIAGTIGGGILEAEVMKKAADVIRNRSAYINEFHLKGKDFSDIDMTCGGDLEVLVDYIDSSDPSCMEIFEYLSTNSDRKGLSYLVTTVPDNEAELKASKQFIIKDDCSLIGTSAVSEEFISRILSSPSKYKVFRDENQKRYIVEAVNIPHCAYIFGAGHVGQKLAQILKFVDFNVTVIDDRAEFANSERFPQADRIVAKPVTENLDEFNIDRFSYIVIVTRGHINDELVLSLSLKTAAGYIGMIGSRGKREGVYRNLLASGFTDRDIARVYSPIGLPIGADTPEEIAVSIAAEMIKARKELSE